MLYHPHGYGSTVRVPGTSSVLSMRVHGDNFGPHSTASVQAAYAMLRRKFPNAAVRAPNLSQMGDVLEPVSGSFPLLTKEIGDSWIYGTGSDPTKSADLRELLRLRGEWLEQGRIRPADEVDLYLRRCDTYRVGELTQARAEDPDFRLNDQEWNTKRARPARAAAALPEPLRDEAAQRLEALRERAPHPDQAQAYGSDTTLDNGILRATVSARTGALVELTDLRSGRQWAGPGGLGTFSYEVFDAEQYLRYHQQYNHASFTYNDFGKPGLENYPATPGGWTATAAGLRAGAPSVSVIADLIPPVSADRNELLAWPSRVALRYDLRPGSDEIGMTCWLEGKRANRRPEAYWIAFCPNAPDVTGWRMDKLGQEVDPLDVIDDGGRHLHGVGRGARYCDDRGSLRLGTLDAHLVSPGGPGLLRFDNDPLDLSAGVWVNLYNNLWGTAFPQWYDQDMRFRFTLTVRGPTEDKRRER